MVQAYSLRRRGGIPQRYGLGLQSTRRTMTRPVPEFEFDDFVSRREHGRCQPSLPLLVELVNAHEAGRWCEHEST